MDNDFDEFPGLTDEEVEEITRPIFEKLCDGHQPKRYAGELALASHRPAHDGESEEVSSVGIRPDVLNHWWNAPAPPSRHETDTAAA